ncbi:hypothetical protein JCM15765_10210 [Paradesulfitobacterium aromaticivorans]
MRKIWRISRSDRSIAQELADTLGISPVLADILAKRGVNTPREAVSFLKPSLLSLSSPFLFKDMRKAVGRLTWARERGEKVLVYGDYDVDGVTSTALVYKTLIDLGFKAVTYIPSRHDEGYGLNKEAIGRAVQAEVKVLVTVDCGITATEEIELATAHGIDVIITDHHEPPEILPAALAVINPKCDPNYPFTELAGVGVAFKLVQGLLEESDKPGAERELLDLVALGTIADVVPLVGENRVLVKHGLKQMQESPHLGLEVLLAECGLKGKELKAGQIAFMVAPRINAAGRLDSARKGLELLLTGKEERAYELARELTQENLARQRLEQEIVAKAIEQIEQSPLPRVIVVSGQGWHHGVIGIVASRLVERYYRPVFIMGEEGEEAKGSARGIPGYHVLEELRTQAQLLHKFGGHRQAAGFSLAVGDIGRLRAELNEQATALPEEVFQEVLTIDCVVEPAVLTVALEQELEHLAPYGFGNPSPVLAVQRMPVHRIDTVGQEGKHLKLYLGEAGNLGGIVFRQGSRLRELADKPAADIAFNLELNSYQGHEKVQVVVKDIEENALWQKEFPELDRLPRQAGELAAREIAAGLEADAIALPSATGNIALAEFRTDIDSTRKRCASLEREELAKVYRSLQAAANVENPFIWDVQEEQREALQIFEELGFVRCAGGSTRVMLELMPVQGKLPLESSLRYLSGKRC